MQETETEAKHTPGPWHTGAGNGEGYIFGPDGTRRDLDGLASIAMINGRKPQDEANARLIAAAPDLLEALSAALRDSGGGVSGPTHPDVAEDEGQPRWAAFARAAIAKAEGGGE